MIRPLTADEIELFKSYTDNRYSKIPNSIYICFIRDDIDIIEFCKTNNLNFNYLVDKDNYIQMTDDFTHSNGTYKLFGEEFNNNKNTKQISIGILVGDSKDEYVKGMNVFISFVSEFISKLDQSDAKDISFKLIEPNDVDGIFFKVIDNNFKIDTIFRFYDLFKQ